MTLRARLLVYLLAVHVVVAVVLAWHADRGAGLLLVELGLVLSLATGAWLVRTLFAPIEMVRTGTDLIAEGDFTSHFATVGAPDMDALIRTYNAMIDRLRAERLRQVEQHAFRGRLLEALPSAVIVLDFDGRIAELNPAAVKLVGRTPDALMGRRLDEPDLGPLAELAELAAGDSRVIAVDGGRRIRASCERFYESGFRRRFVVLEELTDELRASERAAYRRLVRMMSHEVANSVGAVGSLLESVRPWAGDLQPARQADFAAAIDVSRTRLRNLNGFMNQLAELVRLPPPDRRPVDLTALLDDIAVLLRPQLEARRITIERAGVAGSAPVSVDKNQFEQVLLNVFKNAIEAIDQDGTIEVELTPTERAVRLTIRDSGNGITAEAHRALFTPFFSTKPNGLGLGLTLVQEILGQHGLEYGLSDREAGRGAKFFVDF